MQLLADDLVIIAAGRLVSQGPVQEVLDTAAKGRVRVRTPNAEALVKQLAAQQISVSHADDGALLVAGADAPTVGRAALAAQVELHELSIERPDLERVFLELTAGKAGIR
jgi:ABC-2 type transport system ATP-binding protein